MTFQSTLPRRERRIKAWRSSSANRFQSTLPRRERLILTLFLPEIGIFQSTLPRRERLMAETSLGRMTNFNPHSHEGSDFEQAVIDTAINAISIHTPTKGATNSCIKKESCLHNFNPHSHEGSDICQDLQMNQNSYFNPHSHEGSDVVIQLYF